MLDERHRVHSPGAVRRRSRADPILDLAVASGVSSATVLFGNGDSSFGTTVDLGPVPTSITAADVNGDGYADVVATDRFFLSNGDKTFRAGRALPLVPNANAMSVTTADFDADGHVDLAMTGGNGVAVYLGDGTGSFRALGACGGCGYLYSQSIVAADFNRDGRPDIALADYDGAARVFLNQAP